MVRSLGFRVEGVSLGLPDEKQGLVLLLWGRKTGTRSKFQETSSFKVCLGMFLQRQKEAKAARILSKPGLRISGSRRSCAFGHGCPKP